MANHKSLATILLIFCSYFLLACQSSNPEALLGLRLGKPRTQQLTELLNKGEIKEERDRFVVPYSDNLVGILRVDSIESEGEQVITSIGVYFDNPNRHSWTTKIDQEEKDYLLKEFFSKYGATDLKPERGEEYIWDKGDMLITLYFDEDKRLDEPLFIAWADYSYKDAIIEKLKAKSKGQNRKI